ncbi:MAG: hypothetical protein COA96_05980 [SAR86 cluster bacterium]|uniref:Large ribosomal RNA subunit accumulation protein YceD n=1 Tax=SAR86 cluster bacterium TaxID=2030880 RepID=A0A2A5B4S1_9GAMM|nr:MAG: hypothetical protein COA96_05980 [SAR86 cluster bacterium]
MLDSSIPAYVDTRKAFLQEAKISGKVSLERMPRFQSCLISTSGSVNIELSFDVSETKQRIISGTLRAEVKVACQRCLEPLEITLTDDIRLALLKDEAEAEGLETELDPWFCEDYKLDVAPLIEEQLILCMPNVNYHQSGECAERKNYIAGQESAGSDAQSAHSESPFSILKSLKKNDLSD